MTPKSTLRTEVRARLSLISAADREARSQMICERLRALPEWGRAQRVALYSALPDEPDLAALLVEGSAGAKLCLPRMTGDHLIFLEVCSPSDLEISRWGLAEPIYRQEAIIPVGSIDLVILPGVAFTSEGYRMGRGRGYYDRFLAQPGFRAETVGVCFREQLVEYLPLEDHDLPVSRVISA